VEFGARQAWLKSSPLHGSAAWRYGMAAGLGLDPPRERELANAYWLRERLFVAPEPLAAGALRRGPRLLQQFLISARVEHQGQFAAVFEAAPADQRRQLLSELAREVARMHALGFAHGDLYPRNVLVRESAASGDPRRLLFLDAWRRPAHWRAAWLANGRRESGWFARDWGCWMLEGAALLSVEEQRLLFETYAAERDRQGRRCRLDRLLELSARARAREFSRVQAEPRRWRTARPPAAKWEPPRARRLPEG
jgi:hypothetical protein